MEGLDQEAAEAARRRVTFDEDDQVGRGWGLPPVDALLLGCALVLALVRCWGDWGLLTQEGLLDST